MQKTPDYTPDPYDFVASYYDLSDVTVYFTENVEITSDYEDQHFTVVVEDVYGNAVSQLCTLSIIWMKNEYTMELGTTLHREELLYAPDRDSNKIAQGDIDVVNEAGAGEYTVASLVDGNVCQVHVVDTTPPELSVTDISIFKGKKVTVDDFVESCSDITDINGNTTTATATLAVVRDKKPPVIK